VPAPRPEELRADLARELGISRETCLDSAAGDSAVWGSSTRCSVLTRGPRVLVVVDDRWMPLLSIVYQLVRWLLGLIAVLVRKDRARTPNSWCCATRTPCCAASSPGCAPRPGELAWPAALPRVLPPLHGAAVLPVAPTTIQAWHHRLAARK
jgi:hypothetical protein